MTVRSEGLDGVRTVLSVSIEATQDLSEPLTKAAEEWRKTVARSFGAQAGPGGRRWPPAKDPENPLGIRTGAMAAGEDVRVLPTGLQGLSTTYYRVFFVSGAKLGNRAAGARKKPGQKKARRKRGTSLRGTGPKVQPARPLAPVEPVRGAATVLDEEWFESLLNGVADHLVGGES